MIAIPSVLFEAGILYSFCIHSVFILYSHRVINTSSESYSTKRLQKGYKKATNVEKRKSERWGLRPTQLINKHKHQPPRRDARKSRPPPLSRCSN